ncbi:MAG: MBL fold metallo-hydrolase [Candidatus Hydrogenedentota bacterium]|nr:MAG: MBL fold metallo-hydrolase [Candidatus Hydrogenedentota bacterium]
MQITIHRGTKEIGGSCIELQSGVSRIVLDMGMPLVNGAGDRFDMRDHDGLTGAELVVEKVLPNVEGLYAWQEPSVDAVFITHAHQDHYGFLEYVHPDIPVYMSEGTKKLIEITVDFTPMENPLNTVELFSWHESYTVGPFTIIPHLVDHSCFSAFALEIEADGKRVFYSGDFRDHGPIAKKAMKALYNRVKPGVDALLMEGTMLGRTGERVRTEEELSEEATEICKQTEGIVFIFQSGQNISRAVSFYKAAKRMGRYFVLDVYAAHVMSEVSKCEGGGNLPYPGKSGFELMRVWYPYWLNKGLRKRGKTNILNQHARHKITKPEMGETPDKMVVFVRPTMASDLDHIKNLEGSTLIYSLWDGYKEDSKTKAFLELVETKGIKIETLHTSGHAEYSALQNMVDTLKPKKLFPIHTFHPDQFGDFGEEVQELEDGVPVTL